ncbi:hypothetical protein K402DRAFT_393618 [Aulographum hederae CBS 113979]|uniref:Uncharacterized protein n=1 Tax=Aulographum hederae CBS 113979 TaxID=1176131 RepID=A0A6G1H022_9PEZI|nr:hypothetical protein K402DRAFT_393618 [Aulographum hederae CBS 113979]
MNRPTLMRRLRAVRVHNQPTIRDRVLRRFESTTPARKSSDAISKEADVRAAGKNGSNSSSKEANVKGQERVRRILASLPPFLRRPLSPLLSAPVSHITSFLILHEITAILPLIGLAAGFHWVWFPENIIKGEARGGGEDMGGWFGQGFGEGFGKTIEEGVGRYGRYFRRKGWVGEGVEEEIERGEGEGGEGKGLSSGARVVVEVATAYAITKALLPVRLMASLWATPWFARVAVLPISKLGGKLFGKSKSP